MNLKNEKKINMMLDEVQKRSKERNITHTMLCDKFFDLFKKLDIPRSNLEGVSGTLSIHADRYPKAYKYKAMGTVVDFIIKKNGVIDITDCYRGDVKNVDVWKLNLTESVEKLILNKYRRF